MMRSVKNNELPIWTHENEVKHGVMYDYQTFQPLMPWNRDNMCSANYPSNLSYIIPSDRLNGWSSVHVKLPDIQQFKKTQASFHRVWA